MSVQKRIYVGNLLNDPESCLQALEARFGKFGHRLDGFESHGNFAYMDMTFEDENMFNKLKSSFNRVKFKGNDLRVDAARPRWQWEDQKRRDDEEEPVKREQIAKRHWEYYKKMENINMSWEGRMQLIPGRHRKNKRNKHQMRNITFRVDVNGSLKVYKCYKQKLWGYERDKEFQDLVYRFVNGKWRNGTDHIVDRLNYARSKGVHGFEPRNRDEQEAELEEQEEDDSGEKGRTDKVLEDMFKSFDFDKPIVDDEAVPEGQRQKEEPDEDKEPIDYQEEEEKDDEAIPEKPEEKKISEKSENSTNYQEEIGDEDEDEPIPNFGESNRMETLRNLFNPQENQPFKLMTEVDDDIDHGKDLEQEKAVEAPELTEREAPALKKSAALFFPHFDSPFLSGQTQLNKLPVYQPDWQSWQDQFWDERIDWIKDMKRKRKDVLRQLAKRKSKNSISILV